MKPSRDRPGAVIEPVGSPPPTMACAVASTQAGAVVECSPAYPHTAEDERRCDSGVMTSECESVGEATQLLECFLQLHVCPC